MVEMAYGAIGVVSIITLVSIVRILQYRRWYILALQNHNMEFTSPIIFMLDFYQKSLELQTRIEHTAELYKKLCAAGYLPRVILTIGALKGMNEPIAFIDKNLLKTEGVPAENIHTYLGKNFRGAADTFEEVRLACKYAHTTNRDRCMYVVANSLQAVQAFMICLREGIFPVLEQTPLLEESGTWTAGKLFHLVLAFFSPRGNNLLSIAQRFVRRHVSAAI